MTIPRLQEDPERRRLRTALDECDRMISAMRSCQSPPVQEAVPDPVKVAMTYVQIFQHSTTPQCSKGSPFFHMGGGENMVGEDAIFSRDPHPEEEYALASACQLLADYFDRNNLGLQELKVKAKVPTKKDALAVVENRVARRK